MISFLLVVMGSVRSEPQVNAKGAPMSAKVNSADKTNLTQCPDCTGKVSKRAAMCPHCGCPGEAIKLAVYRAEQAAKPKSVVQVISDSGKGHALAVKDGDSTYVIFDAFLLANSMKLELRDVRDDKMISYSAVELAEQAGLMRLKVTSDQLDFKSLAKPNSTPSIYLDALGFKSKLKMAVGCLKSENELCGLIQGAKSFAIHSDMKWKAVKPKPLRQQLDLLSRLQNEKAKGKKPVMTSGEASTIWLTPYFAELASELTQ